MSAVPILDLTPAGEGPAGRRAVARRIGEACETIGFFSVVGHGVPAAVSDAAWTAARAFFDRPPAVKRAVRMPYAGYPYGYSPFAGERLASSRGQATPPDLKESFSVGPLDRPAVEPSDPDEAFAFAATPWPARPAEFRPALSAYYRAMADLAARLLDLFALALDLEEDFFRPLINRHVSALRVLNYPDPPVPPAPGQLRAGAHSDYGTLTILRQDPPASEAAAAPGGLQVRDRDGRWHDVPAVPGALVINIGDLMARWTNDRWVSTLHRVVNPPPDAWGSTRRQSIAFFHNLNWDAEVACLASCRGPDRPSRYPPVRAGAYLMAKFRSTVDPEVIRS